MKDVNIDTIEKIRFLEWIEPMAKNFDHNNLSNEDKEFLELIRKIYVAIDRDKLEAELKVNNTQKTRKVKV